MKLWKLLLTIFILVLSSSVNAALLSRDLDGNLSTIEAYYDDVANLTWLADANYSRTSGYDSDGLMTWNQAQSWVFHELNYVQEYGGGRNWRLPNVPDSDDDCAWYTAADCYQGEMAQLYYNSLGKAGSRTTTLGPFENVQLSRYWTSGIDRIEPGLPGPYGASPSTRYIQAFNMYTGLIRATSEHELHYAWAVHDGDIGVTVSAVPIPATMWLFGSGLIGLVSFARRVK
jgi:hypothetical protein